MLMIIIISASSFDSDELKNPFCINSSFVFPHSLSDEPSDPSFCLQKNHKKLLVQFVEHIEGNMQSENSRTYHDSIRGGETAGEEFCDGGGVVDESRWWWSQGRAGADEGEDRRRK